MPRKSTKVAKVRSHAEEADWYTTPDGRRQTEREFVRALRNVTLLRLTGLKVTKTDPKVLEQLMEQAKENGLCAGIRWDPHFRPRS
jgi:hypothetical protein